MSWPLEAPHLNISHQSGASHTHSKALRARWRISESCYIVAAGEITRRFRTLDHCDPDTHALSGILCPSGRECSASVYCTGFNRGAWLDTARTG
jgi:hypothetical protein